MTIEVTVSLCTSAHINFENYHWEEAAFVYICLHFHIRKSQICVLVPKLLGLCLRISCHNESKKQRYLNIYIEKKIVPTKWPNDL